LKQRRTRLQVGDMTDQRCSFQRAFCRMISKTRNHAQHRPSSCHTDTP